MTTEVLTPAIRLARLQAQLEEARSQLAENPEAVSVKDMAPGLDEVLGQLRQLSPAEGKAYLPQLQALMQGFAEIAADYKRIVAAAGNDLHKLNHTSKAHTAYARSGATTGKRDERQE